MRAITGGPTSAPHSHHEGLTSADRDIGLRVVIAYKFIRGVVVIALGITLLVLQAGGFDDRARDYVLMIQRHFTAAWVHRLADALARLLTARNVVLVGAGLCFDGCFSLFEGWSLHRRFAWAPWLVVVASSTFIPFEILAIIRHLRFTRIAITLINVAIVVYLAMRVKREHAARSAHRAAGAG